jgi:hypothetical protein
MPRFPLLALLAAALIAGCGDDDKGGNAAAPAGPAAIVSAAVKASEDTDSYKMRFGMDSDLGGQKIAMDGEIVSSADSGVAYFKGQFAQGGPPKSMEFISRGKDNYVRGELVEGALPAGKKWLRMGDETPTTMTPPEFLEFLRTSPSIKEVGRDDVRGERAVHLRGPLDMKKLAESTSSAAAQKFAKIPQAEEMKVVVDVWIRETDDRLARMALELTHPDAPGAMKMSGDIVDYDVSLDSAQAPPADQVVDQSELGG